MSSYIDYDMPFPLYLANPAYGSSDLHAFRKGPPAVVPWRRANRGGDTPSTILGRAAHCAFLTPHLFDREFVVKPEGMDFRSKEAKAQRDEWLSRGMTILSHEQGEAVRAITAALKAKDAVRDSIIEARGVEASVFWRDLHGLPRKARPDWFTEETVYDLKVTIVADSGLPSLPRRAMWNGWLHQLAGNRAALNAAGMNIKRGRLVVVSPTAPHPVWLVEVRGTDLDYLEFENEHTSAAMVVCHQSGTWPGTPEQWETIELPQTGEFQESDLQGVEEAVS